MKILLYFFARYLLAPLFVAVMIFVLTGIKTIKSKLSLKRLIIFILLASITVALPCLFGFLRNEYVWGGLAFTTLSYILLGVLFYKLSTSDLFTAIGIKGSRTAVILTLVTVCALGGWCYYLLFELISKLPYSLWNTTNIIWFAVPYLIMYNRTLFMDIPHPIYTPWELSYGTFDRKYWDNIDNFGFQTVKVKIKRKINDSTYASLVVRLPNEISLGNWFNWVIEDQNRRFPQNKIETEKDDMRIGWMFYTSKWFKFPLFVRILDHQANNEGNRIKNNQTIYIRRVQIDAEITTKKS
ncbi:TssN family type VI secretion system protein [uncultured Bacteroides sp.]|uniref:TssN family type VI secretion system protein n=1 Tax=uncultured Bacteroides sp. TaxID=162156 RepID=UPI0025963787|nr:TssN family type VI secretion system protein [uncultured Bacteroides sp.]